MTRENIYKVYCEDKTLTQDIISELISHFRRIFCSTKEQQYRELWIVGRQIADQKNLAFDMYNQELLFYRG